MEAQTTYHQITADILHRIQQSSLSQVFLRRNALLTWRAPKNLALCSCAGLHSQLYAPLPIQAAATDIVGLAGRYPGASPDAGIPAFWDTLRREADLPSNVPLQRWDIDEYYSPESKGRQLSMYVRMAAFVDGLDAFDAGLFRYGQ